MITIGILNTQARQSKEIYTELPMQYDNDLLQTIGLGVFAKGFPNQPWRIIVAVEDQARIIAAKKCSASALQVEFDFKISLTDVLDHAKHNPKEPWDVFSQAHPGTLPHTNVYDIYQRVKDHLTELELNALHKQLMKCSLMAQDLTTREQQVVFEWQQDAAEEKLTNYSRKKYIP